MDVLKYSDIQYAFLWFIFFFFFNDPSTTEIYTYCHTLSLPDALPISPSVGRVTPCPMSAWMARMPQTTSASSEIFSTPSTRPRKPPVRSEEHTSELQSLMRISYAVFCLKKKTKNT